jgi:hypothetical protein
MFSMSEQVMNSWRKSWTSLELTIGNQAKDGQAFEKLSKLFLPQQTRLLFKTQRRFQCVSWAQRWHCPLIGKIVAAQQSFFPRTTGGYGFWVQLQSPTAC